MIVDLYPAFADGNQGLSIWLTPDGRCQASVKSAQNGFLIGYGDTPQEALDDVWRNAALPSLKPKAAKPRRGLDLI